ncbi:MAG: D-alanine--D-alanine ligase, partial [Candidatus Omnitrophota bacterium]
MAVIRRIRESENQRIKNKFGRIGVLMGGPSTERKISLKSGHAVNKALRNSGVDTVAIDIKTDNIRENTRLIRSSKIDVAFIALHGCFGEDGQIQELLSTLKIPYTGSGIMASRLAIDKVASRKIFQTHGLAVPKYKAEDRFSYNTNWRVHNTNFSLPLVVKPVTHGSSIGLSIVDKRGDLDKAADLAFSFDERIVIEEYIKGREVTVGILVDKALPVIEIVPKTRFFDYEAKYQIGMTEYIVPAKLGEDLSRKIQEAALMAHKLLGCFGCSRVDMILDRYNIPFVLEVNTIPGFT